MKPFTPDEFRGVKREQVKPLLNLEVAYINEQLEKGNLTIKRVGDPNRFLIDQALTMFRAIGWQVEFIEDEECAPGRGQIVREYVFRDPDETAHGLVQPPSKVSRSGRPIEPGGLI